MIVFLFISAIFISHHEGKVSGRVEGFKDGFRAANIIILEDKRLDNYTSLQCDAALNDQDPTEFQKEKWTK